MRHTDKDCPWEWRRPSPDRVIAFCETNGVAMHGHVIIYPLTHPKWVTQESSRDEAAKLYEKRVYDIALYYKGRYRLSWAGADGIQVSKFVDLK